MVEHGNAAATRTTCYKISCFENRKEPCVLEHYSSIVEAFVFHKKKTIEYLKAFIYRGERLTKEC